MGEFDTVGFDADGVGKRRNVCGARGVSVGTCMGTGQLGAGQYWHDIVMLGGRAWFVGDWKGPEVCRWIFVAS